MCKLNYSYWEEEIPNGAEYHEAIYNLDRHNRKVDVILSHTCPREIIRIMGHYPDEHDMELTGFLEFLMYEIDYSKWFFGHWHRDQKLTDKFTALFFDVIRL